MVYTELIALPLILTQNRPIKKRVLVPPKSPTSWRSMARCPVPASLTSAPESKPRGNTSSVEQDKFMFQFSKSACKACFSNQNKRKADGRIWATVGEIIFLGAEKICNSLRSRAVPLGTSRLWQRSIPCPGGLQLGPTCVWDSLQLRKRLSSWPSQAPSKNPKVILFISHIYRNILSLDPQEAHPLMKFCPRKKNFMVIYAFCG